ncbi:MAG: hypothetical protein HKM06_03205 [Spirochaetales bacterium]|nr:hypothetical protein [Spirochaetales bacterium]
MKGFFSNSARSISIFVLLAAFAVYLSGCQDPSKSVWEGILSRNAPAAAATGTGGSGTTTGTGGGTTTGTGSNTGTTTGTSGGSTAIPPPYVASTTNTSGVNFGPYVYVFSPTSTNIQSEMDTAYNAMESNQFGTATNPGFAFLFKPGVYSGLNMQIGFYTEMAGLGFSPDDVQFTGSLLGVTGEWAGGACTTNFWREAENFRFTNSGSYNGMNQLASLMWAVSQAAPLRRLDIDSNLALFEVPPGGGGGEYASGGFMADSYIGGTVTPGSQQQWFSRNSNWGTWSGAVWNEVFVGDNSPAASNWVSSGAVDPPLATPTNYTPYTVVTTTPVVREKPFLYLDSSNNYYVFVPGVRSNSTGPDWKSGTPVGTSVSLNDFYITQVGDTAEKINAQLALGKDLLITPGIYYLDQPITLVRPDTVVLGLGVPTLVPTAGNADMIVPDYDGEMIAGILFDAGTVNSQVLLQVGPTGASASHATDPTTLSDVFFRVGGDIAGKANACLIINSNNVIVDDTWAWRADHGNAGTVGWNVNTATNGVIVNGANVTIYGLAVEHFQQYQTLWNGNGGQTYFYQSELPYDVPSQSDWMSTWNGTSYNGWASYKVSDSVTSHQAWGMGIYGVFINTNGAVVNCDHAVETPTNPSVKFNDVMALDIISSENPSTQGYISHALDSVPGQALPSNFTQYPRIVSYP